MIARVTTLIHSYLGLRRVDRVGIRAINCSDEVKDSIVLKNDNMLTAISCITVSGTSAFFSGGQHESSVLAGCSVAIL